MSDARIDDMNLADKQVLCIPGDALVKNDAAYVPGDGVYVRFGYIHAAIAGKVQLVAGDSETQRVNVIPTHKPNLKIPSVGSIVTCKITHIGPNYARAEIHCVEDTVLKHSFRAVIRKEDIREVERGTVEIYKCFRVGDVVLARVIGVGEHHSFLLSTAEDELGVAVAYSQFNKETPMLPVNWTQMRCPKTYVRELRKVAKISFDVSDTGTSAQQTSN